MSSEVQNSLPAVQQHPIETPASSQQCCIVEWAGHIWNWINEQILCPIGLFIQTLFSYCCHSAIPVAIDPHTRARILPAPSELTPANETIFSKKLVNLYSTCYMNATLQMIAATNAFNQSLTSAIPLPPRENFSTDQEHARAVAICENKQLFKGHLAAIIQKMRSPNTHERITATHLSDLFTLAQVCGWRKQFWQQQDPHEFTLFLRQALNEQSNFLHMACTQSFILDGAVQSHLGEEQMLSEIALEIPDVNAMQRTSPGTTMCDLIDLYTTETIENYKPRDESDETVSLHKKHHFLSPAPETLFIQEKRFGWNAHGPYRISTAVPGPMPFNPTLTVPFHEVNDRGEVTLSETKQYRLKTVICHHGGGSASSGHYTTLRAQHFNEQETWVLYNDAKEPQRYPSNDPAGLAPPIVSNIIKTNAYYLAYELVDDSLTGLPE